MKKKPRILKILKKIHATDDEVYSLALSLRLFASASMINAALRATNRIGEPAAHTERNDLFIYYLMALSAVGELCRVLKDSDIQKRFSSFRAKLDLENVECFDRLTKKPMDELVKAVWHTRGVHVAHHEMGVFKKYADRVKDRDIDFLITDGEGASIDTTYLASIDAMFADTMKRFMDGNDPNKFHGELAALAGQASTMAINFAVLLVEDSGLMTESGDANHLQGGQLK